MEQKNELLSPVNKKAPRVAVHPETGFLGYKSSFPTYAESLEYQLPEILDDDIIYDLGAHIGFFTNRCLELGAKKVVAFECATSALQFLKQNVKDRERVVIVEKAVSGERGSGSVSMNIAKRTSANHIIQRVRKPKATDITESIETIGLFDAFDIYGAPTIMKVDIEGSEFSLPWEKLPPTVRWIAMELHPWRKSFVGRAKEMLEIFESLGFNTVVAPDLDSITWYKYITIGTWSR